jgi:flagellar assembly factor FliW
MQIETTRFGLISVADDQLLTFPKGLIGLAELTRFALLPGPDNGSDNGADNDTFYWMQAIDDPEVAFLVTDPNVFFKDYDVPVREETQQDLQLADTKDGRLLVICNRVGQWLTGNLLGPLVINTASRVGEQVVITEKKWTCRQPLVQLQVERAIARAAA